MMDADAEADVDDDDEKKENPADEELRTEIDQLEKSLRLGNNKQPQTQKSGRGTLPWLEKYRPKVLDDVVDQSQTVLTLSNCAKIGSLPNLLLYGPPGTGKTSAILALARQLYGWNTFDLKQNVLELNASNERGIDVIREKVKVFARFMPNANLRRAKLVVLDEADSMTRDAQGALRRLMETQVGVTRFCLICNYVTKIIEPIISRTVHFRFRPLSVSAVVQRLQYICTHEKVVIPLDALQAVAQVSEGDMRRAIATLYAVHRDSVYRCGRLIVIEDVLELSGVIPPKVIDDILATLNVAHSFNDIQMVAKEVTWAAYPPIKLLRLLADRVATIPSPRFDDKRRALINLQIGATEEALLNAANPLLQLTALFSHISQILTDTTAPLTSV
jgi:replication factor C subunit 2/4